MDNRSRAILGLWRHPETDGLSQVLVLVRAPYVTCRLTPPLSPTHTHSQAPTPDRSELTHCAVGMGSNISHPGSALLAPGGQHCGG